MKSKWRYPRWYHYIQPGAYGFRKQTILFFHSLQICNKNNVCKRNGLIHNLLGWIHLQHTRIAVAFACWDFLLFLGLKTIKTSNKQIRQLYAYVAYESIIRVYLSVGTCELFLCFAPFVSQFLWCWPLCSLCFTSTVSFTGFYTQDEPHFICCAGKFRCGCFENLQQARRTKPLPM